MNASPAAKFMITGTTVVLEMASGGLFMENCKIEKQRTSQPYPTIMRTILKQGIRGFEAGLVPWGLILGFTKGAVLGSSNQIFKNKLGELGWSTRRRDITAGAMAGGVQGVFMSPLLLARTRINQAITEGAKETPPRMPTVGQQVGVLSNMVKTEGVGSLTKGMPLFIVKRTYDWGTRFVFLGEMRRMMMARKAPGENLNDWEKLFSAFMAGALATFMTVPVDRMAPVIQAAGSEAKDGILNYLRKKIAEEGVSTMFRGCVARTIHTGYHTCFAIFLADKIADLMNGRP
jgi:hypothetical protein